MRLFATAFAAAAIAVPAIGQTSENGIVLTNPEFAGGFDNFGQCQAALAKVRNEQRKAPETRGGDPYTDLSGSDYNRASRETTKCEKIDGRYYVVFNANGI